MPWFSLLFARIGRLAPTLPPRTALGLQSWTVSVIATAMSTALDAAIATISVSGAPAPATMVVDEGLALRPAAEGHDEKHASADLEQVAGDEQPRAAVEGVVDRDAVGGSRSAAGRGPEASSRYPCWRRINRSGVPTPGKEENLSAGIGPALRGKGP
jgi:hypothetical protein